MSGAAGERIRTCLVSAGHRLGTAACLLLVAAVAAGELQLDKRYALALAFTAAQVGCVCGYTAGVAYRIAEPAAARESRNVMLFNFAMFLLAMGWMIMSRITFRSH